MQQSTAQAAVSVPVFLQNLARPRRLRPDEREVVVFSRMENGYLKTLLLENTSHIFIEAGLGVRAQALLASLPEAARFGLSVTTATACHLPLAHMVGGRFRARLGLDKTVEDAVVSALHEAVLNAAVHGNLDIGGGFYDLASFDDYTRAVEKKLLDSAAIRKRIIIAAAWWKGGLRLWVRDEGNGYGAPYRLYPREHPHGNGLRIISACASRVAVREGGREIAMDFLL